MRLIKVIVNPSGYIADPTDLRILFQLRRTPEVLPHNDPEHPSLTAQITFYFEDDECDKRFWHVLGDYNNPKSRWYRLLEMRND